MMSAASIQAKVKKGLAKAADATGSALSDKIYVVKSVTVGSSPLGGGTTTSTTTLLPKALFKAFDAKLFGGTMLAGDRVLVCDNVTAITQGDTIQQGALFYVVVAVDIKAPQSEVLAYIAQVRLK
jgi:hypothetical protein